MWPGGLEEGVLQHSGVLDTAPLVHTLAEQLADRPPQRKFVVGASNSGTGEYTIFDEKVAAEDLAVAFTSSASIPFVFPSQSLYGETFNDGGAIYNVNLVSAIDRCLEEVEDESQIIIDIVICSHHNPIEKEDLAGNTIDNYMRAWEIQSELGSLRDIYEFMRSRPNVQYRYLINPSEDISKNNDGLNFNGTYMWPMVELGQQDAKDHVARGPGNSFKRLEEFFETAVEVNHKPTVHEFTWWQYMTYGGF
jgi:predicted acylesterase/phospholipase RssA